MNRNNGIKRLDPAGACFQGDKPDIVIERLFHKLVAEPDSATGELYAVWAAWTRAGKEQFLQLLGMMLRELLKLPKLAPSARGFGTLCFGWIMQGRLAQVEIETMAREAVSLFRQVSEPLGEAEARCLLGQALQKRGFLL